MLVKMGRVFKREMLTDHNLLQHNGWLHHPNLWGFIRIICVTRVGVRLAFRVWAPGATGKLESTLTIFAPTNPSAPPQAPGRVPGAETGMKGFVCAGSESTWTANEIGRSEPKPFKDGAT
jgi:hypothetical protein